MRKRRTKLRHENNVFIFSGREDPKKSGLTFSDAKLLPESASLSCDYCIFSLNHAIWYSCGRLGGRPRCITVCCMRLRSPAFPGQFCPTIPKKLYTAKVRQFQKCGRIRGPESADVYCPAHWQNLRTYRQTRTTKAERFAVETHHFKIQHAEITGRW